MPPHVIRRGNKKTGVFYLIDGRAAKSLKTKVKRIAEAKLNQYIRGKFRIDGGLTVREFYEEWIENKKPPLVRKSVSRDYKQHFSGYLLLEFGSTSMAQIIVSSLSTFRNKLLGRGLSVKTCRNILDGSFRAMWRDARRADMI